MDEEKNQHIIVLTDFTERSCIALDHGIVLADVLEKELSLLCFAQENEDENMLHEKMQAIAKDRKIQLSTYVLKAKYAKAYNELVAESNAILAIVCFDNTDSKSNFHPARLLKFFHQSRIPYIFANNAITDASYYKKIILPIDSTKESKEKVLWASYFGRFNESELKVMAASVKDEYLLRQMNNNLKFIKKIFDSFEVNFEILRTTQKQSSIDEAAIHAAADENAGLVIILSTKSYGILDLLKGPKELGLITNEERISIMCLNQRDDLYVMCD
jgi:nucleotide-binding universal stress UspA family protein